ncbi:MAG: prolipoprotein diacylglyceryl transferase family protein [Rheinheimera sp.]|nr:prolipoprotein diacylglyceryl transferase family protein [Rheinheimera sp.]
MRHPVQLYEAIAYAIALGIVVISWSRLLKHRAASFGLFLVLVFLIRIALEFFKVEQATYQGAMSLTVGQWLSVPFIVVGLFILFGAVSRHQHCQSRQCKRRISGSSLFGCGRPQFL